MRGSYRREKLQDARLMLLIQKGAGARKITELKI